MMSVDVPTAPGLAIASDYFQAEGKEYVLFVDLFSSWTEYFKVNSRRPSTLIEKLRQFMTRNGVPRILYSDKGSAYESMEFQSFCKEWGIELITCSGEYPQGNGTAEAAVKRVKKWLSGASNEDELSKAILAWHQTPIVEGRPMPAQIHLGRNVRDELSTKVKPCTIPWGEVRMWRSAQKERNASVYNKRARDLPELEKGDRVFVSIHGKWRQAVIERKASRPRSFVLRMLDTGNLLERNRVHLRPDKTRTDPVNSYDYFSADQDQARNSEKATAPDHRQDEPDELNIEEGPEAFPTSSSPEDEYQTADEDDDPDHEQPPPKSTAKQKRVKIDRTQLFLSRAHTSRTGRQSKKIDRYDPSQVYAVF
jgi:hypothetical protein